ncbi:MAG: hypothetical protein EAZ77_12230 [Nostocales cyanobacterium]|nr:MAG: hypothetical protein EAZ77_12230 [Nostocales cyanobacterium]
MGIGKFRNFYLFVFPHKLWDIELAYFGFLGKSVESSPLNPEPLACLNVQIKAIILPQEF